MSPVIDLLASILLLFTIRGGEHLSPIGGTITPHQIADSLGVRHGSNAPRWMWRVTWRIHDRLLPLLHFRDGSAPKDCDLSLKVLWNKAISGLDRRSPAYDAGVTYGMLPAVSRWILLPGRVIAPRFLHFNIELRTVYLDRAVRSIAEQKSPDTKLRLVTLGAGYDPRSVRFLTDGTVDEAYELDVADVIGSKSIMLRRLQRRRPDCKLPTIMECDLNDEERLRRILSEIISTSDGEKWHTVFLFEAVMIYLDKDLAGRILDTCAQQASSSMSTSLVFADRLAKMTYENDTYDAAVEYLRGCGGWQLERDSWCIKPGFARHMGMATLSK